MSTLKTNTIKNTDDVEMYLAKAWVNFNGTGTVAIRAAGTVSSITDRAVGKYTVNFASNMPDANYSVVYSTSAGDTTSEDDRQSVITNLNTGYFYCTSSDSSDNSWADAAIVCAAVFR